MRYLAKLVGLAIGLSFVGFVYGCNEKPIGPSLSIPDLLKTPTELSLAGRRFRLETYAWRDFQPISPPDGQPLIIVSRLINLDSLDIQSSVSVSRVYVVFGGEVWTTSPTDERRPPTSRNVLEFVVRDGPKWGPGVTIDVIAVVKDTKGLSFLLRATDQTIHLTE